MEKVLPRRIAKLVLILLSAVHLLIPIERGFPLVNIGGLQFTVALLTTVFSILLIAIYSRGLFETVCRSNYVFLQIAVSTVFIVSALLSDNVRRALVFPIYYFSTFVLNYIIIAVMLLSGYKSLVSIILVAINFLAAGIGISEFLRGEALPFYNYFDQQFRADMMMGDYRHWARSSGTLGNPIVFSTALCGCLATCMELKSSILKVVLIVINFIAISVTTSRTVILWLFLFGVFYFINQLRGEGVVKTINRFLQITIGLSVMIFFFGEKNLIDPWKDRVGTSADVQSFENLESRQDVALGILVDLVKSDAVDIVFGHGILSGGNFASTVRQGLDTIDNVYLHILYENGLLSLVFFMLCWIRVISVGVYSKSNLFHLIGIIGWLSCGFGFVHIAYASCNYPVVISVAILLSTSKNNNGQLV